MAAHLVHWHAGQQHGGARRRQAARRQEGREACQLATPGRGPWCACCVLRVACCVLRVACCVLRVACGVWRVACCVLRVACCVLRVARGAKGQPVWCVGVQLGWAWAWVPVSGRVWSAAWPHTGAPSVWVCVCLAGPPEHRQALHDHILWRHRSGWRHGVLLRGPRPGRRCRCVLCCFSLAGILLVYAHHAGCMAP
jgi:hypothetical protein